MEFKYQNDWVPEGEERKKGAESLFKEIIAENFLNLDIQVHKANRSHYQLNANKPFKPYYIMKTVKNQRT